MLKYKLLHKEERGDSKQLVIPKLTKLTRLNRIHAEGSGLDYEEHLGVSVGGGAPTAGARTRCRGIVMQQ